MSGLLLCTLAALARVVPNIFRHQGREQEETPDESSFPASRACRRAAHGGPERLHRGPGTGLLRRRGGLRGAAGVAVRSGGRRTGARLLLDRRRMVLGGRALWMAPGLLGRAAPRLPLGAAHLGARGGRLGRGGGPQG